MCVNPTVRGGQTPFLRGIIAFSTYAIQVYGIGVIKIGAVRKDKLRASIKE